MDTRKVLEMGGGTFLISLPKSWAKKNGIVRGSSVAVEEISARRLMVKPIGESGSGTEEQGGRDRVPEREPELRDQRRDRGLPDGEQRDTRRRQERHHKGRQGEAQGRQSSRLVGLEIVDEDAKSMTLQFLPDPAVLDPEKIVRRMASLISGMLRDSAEGARHDRALLALVGERDDEVDRLYFLLVRTIRTATIDPEVAERYKLEPIECLDYRVLASYLESLGDAVADFSKRAAGEEFGKEVAAQLVQFLDTLEKMGDVAISSFLARRRVQPRRTHTEVAAMRERLGELSKGMVGMKGDVHGHDGRPARPAGEGRQHLRRHLRPGAPHLPVQA